MTDSTLIAQQTINGLNEASSAMILKDWLSIIALFLSAIIAVLIGQYLQDRKSKRDRIYHNKFSIFSTILGLRHVKGGDEQFVICMNQIPIVFHQNTKVIAKLNKFILNHKDIRPTLDDKLSSLNLDLNDLVIEMARDLGYDNIDNELMKSFFYPDSEFFRNDSSRIYNELYHIENSQRLEQIRQQMKPQ